jgi:predicted HTH transcriptional regulator
MKEIVITPEDLQELEEIQSPPTVKQPTELHSGLKKILDFMKQRKFTTYVLLMKKFSINHRSARSSLDVLTEKGLVDKQYALIKCADLVHRKTALFFVVNKKNGKGRGNK